jgi:1-acyl-sn-glycerol-3-phosphate acyltransferase
MRAEESTGEEILGAPRTALVTGIGHVPFASTWGRRLVSLSLYSVFGVLYFALLPLLLMAAALADLRKRSAALRTLAFIGVYLCCELAGVLASFAIWVLNLGGAGAGRDVFLRQNFRLQCWWARTLRRAAFGIFNMKLYVDGEDCAFPGPVLLFARHCSIADTMLPVMLLSEPHGVVLRWVMKEELLWDPCLDIVGNRLRNCFVSRMPEQYDEDVAAVASLFDDLGENDGVVMYPEGTRFTQSKRQRLIDKAVESANTTLAQRVQRLQHVLPPRLGGTLALLSRNPGADVMFCAHSGLEGSATFWDLLSGAIVGTHVHISLWRVPFADVPTETVHQVAWLHEQWERVDAFVASHDPRHAE